MIQLLEDTFRNIKKYNMFLSFISQDWSNNKGNTKGKIFSFFFRIANYSSKNSFLKILFLPYRAIYTFFFDYLMGFEIPYDTQIGKGIRVFHAQGIVINSKTIIGKNVTIRHNTTIGNAKSDGTCPKIMDNVNIGANTVIIGDITIGEGAVIGAGSVVIRDVPPHSIVAGNPAKIIKQLTI